MKTRLIEWLLSMLGDESDNDSCKHYAKRLGRSFAEESERRRNRANESESTSSYSYNTGIADAYANAAALVWRFFALPESLRPDVAKDIDIKIPISWQ